MKKRILSMFVVIAVIFSVVSITPLTAGATVISLNTTLTQNMTISGDLSHTAGNIDLNGFTLTVNGNLNQTGGYMNINGGTLIISGNYRIQNNSRLSMTRVSDQVKINGNFSMESEVWSHLSAGVMEIGGNFAQKWETVTNFSASGTHRVIFNGTGQQNISFENEDSSFRDVNFQNPNINASGYLRFTGNLLSDVNVAANNLIIGGGSGWLPAQSMRLNGFKINIGGNVIVDDNLTLNGGTLTVGGNLNQTGGFIDINGGTLDIGGNYRIQNQGNLYMTNVSDVIKVGGNFAMESEDTNNQFSAGTMEIGGNFTQKWETVNNFSASGTHRVIFNGTGQQSISFENEYSRFSNVDFQNTDIKASGYLRILNLHSDVNITPDNLTIGEYWSVMNLNGFKMEIDGDVTVDDWINLNNGTLIVNGNLNQAGGRMSINGGTLDIDGNYLIQNNSTLRMTNVSDIVKVGGDFAMESEDGNNHQISAGTLEIGGNFTQKWETVNNFNSSWGTHNVIFNGKGEQKISFENANSIFGNISIGNTTGPIIFETRANVRTAIAQVGGAVVQNGNNVFLDNQSAFVDHGALNADINKYVGNALNVIPTYKDFEAFQNRPPELCEDCYKHPCECSEPPKLCEDCEKDPCECSEPPKSCDFCMKEPCECYHICSDCDMHPCECSEPPQSCKFCEKEPCECGTNAPCKDGCDDKNYGWVRKGCEVSWACTICSQNEIWADHMCSWIYDIKGAGCMMKDFCANTNGCGDSWDYRSCDSSNITWTGDKGVCNSCGHERARRCRDSGLVCDFSNAVCDTNNVCPACGATRWTWHNFDWEKSAKIGCDFKVECKDCDYIGEWLECDIDWKWENKFGICLGRGNCRDCNEERFATCRWNRDTVVWNQQEQMESCTACKHVWYKYGECNSHIWSSWARIGTTNVESRTCSVCKKVEERNISNNTGNTGNSGNSGGSGGGGGGGGGSSTPTTDTPTTVIQQVIGITNVIVNMPVTIINTININIPVVQLVIPAGMTGNRTISVGADFAGQNAILVKYNTTTRQLEFVTASTVGANGNANLNIAQTGDFLVLT
ncbi:MAG: hypothetical protein LBD23_09670, partial [Oscillospiraceae bacterium]|nr:hypothetical protein [Oscillospiraceae bacterium]